MNELVHMKCVPCSGKEPSLNESEIEAYMPEVAGWSVVEVNGEKHLQRVYKFPDFARALEFTNQIGSLAEEEGHHPAITTEWGKVTLAWWTHKIKGLHRNDFIMAARSDVAYAG
jgi:4a-hydroxytetrahydrobiopterin dehydratase